MSKNVCVCVCGVPQAMCNLTVGTRGNKSISDQGETGHLASVSGGTTGKLGTKRPTSSSVSTPTAHPHFGNVSVRALIFVSASVQECVCVWCISSHV